MGVFDKNVTGQPGNERAMLELKYNNSRLNLLWVLIFSAINIVILIAGSSTYFLFSASIPYYLTYYGLFFGGKFSAEVYEEFIPEGYEFIGYGNGFTAVMIILAFLILAVYLLCWIFSKKKRVGWLITALVMFSIDTVAMFVLNGFSVDNILDIVFHVWVIIDLSRGISAYSKLKKLPVTEVTVEENAAVCEVITDDVTPVNNAGEGVSADIAENPAENRVEVNDDANFV